MLFLQRVDEMFDATGEDSSQAVKEADPGYIANEGKPPSKLKLNIYPFLLSFVSFILYHVSIIFIWVGIVLFILGKLHTPHILPIWEKQSRTSMIPTTCRDHHLALADIVT